MTKRRCLSQLLAAAVVLLLPVGMRAQSCGPFTDVPASDVFCPFILQAFFNSVTQGTSATTFSPNDLLPRNQVVTFFDRTMDITLHRATVRTALGRTWTASSTYSGVNADVGGGVQDIVSDGTFLWMARNDGKILKVNAADRRTLETWSLVAGLPKKLGIFAGLVFAADDQGGLHFFDPHDQPGVALNVFPKNTIPAGPSPSLAFDGVNVWYGNSSTSMYIYYQLGTTSGSGPNFPANPLSMVFDGSNMWVLLANRNLLKLTTPAGAANPPGALETLTLPGAVTECKMVFDGANIWIPQANGSLYVVRPQANATAPPSSIVKNEAIPNVGTPFTAAFDGENVMIGGLNNGTVALYHATNLAFLRTFTTTAVSIHSIASDGRTFNIGDNIAFKFIQF